MNDDEVFYSFKKDDPNPVIPYHGGLLLSAVPGEERVYNISLKINDNIYQADYLIDKKNPLPVSSEYTENENGSGYRFNLIENDAAVYYGFDEYNRNQTYLWEGELITPPKSGFIYYFTVDSAGNKSRTTVITPPIINKSTYRADLNVKSPVEGIFLNTQLLYIDKEGFEWIRYTLNGYDPEESGSEYNEPVEIRRYGTVNLKIAAKPYNSSRIIRKDITYQVNTKAPLKNVPESGIYADTITFRSNLSGHRYCLEDRSPNADDPVIYEKLQINPIYGGVKYSTVRINNSDNPTEGDYRFFYVIDDRFPASPIIECDSRLPSENIVDVSISGPVYSDIYYSIDGTTPGKSSNLYKKSFSLEIPENKNAGSVIIKARAVSLNGKPSGIVSRIFTYDTMPPEKPEVSIVKNSDSGLYELEYSLLDDERLFFTISETEDADYSNFYPVSRENFFLDIPDGMTKNFQFIFAAADSAGNWSEKTEPIKITIDKTVPPSPVVTFENNKITIESSYKIFYNLAITRNDRMLFSKNDKYETPVLLEDDFLDGTLSLNVTLQDENNRQYNYRYKYYFPEKPREKEAVLFSRKSEDIYSGSDVIFYAYPDGINEELFYFLTEYDNEGKGILSGPFDTNGIITIEGTDKRKIDYLLEVYSINKESGKKSKVSNYEFTIDNEKPAIPVISGIENGAVVSDRVIISHESDEDSIVFLNSSNDKESLGYLFTDDSIIFNKDIVFDVEENEEKDFFLKIGAGDAAGNSVENEEIFRFRIDKKAPDFSNLHLNVDSAVHNDNIEITCDNYHDIKYYYETGLKGTSVPIPDLNSDFFIDKLILENNINKDSSFIIKIIPADTAGNIGKFPMSFMYRIDKDIPVTCEPEVSLNENNNKVFVSWPLSEDRIYYRITKDGPDKETEGWIEYFNPFSVKYSSSTKDIVIEYYFEDDAGNKSSTAGKRIDLPTTLNTVLAEGIVNNSFYNTDLELKKSESRSLIRYEISTEQVIPPEVSVFSPELPEILPFRIADGESINFTVSLKEYKDYNDRIGGAEQVLRFTIDKQNPEPPVIRGINDGEYYLDNCSASFESSADKIFFSISNNTDQESVFTEYKEQFEIKSPEGTFYSFTINAYTEDFAGNKSSVKSWNITIDKEIIYVSKDGKDYYEGTRSKPFQSINKALEQVKLSERKTIFLEEGVYDIISPSVIDQSVTLYGGFRKGNWQDKIGVSILNLGESFVEDNPAFYVYGGSFTFENIEFNIFEEFNNTVFYINKGDLNIRNSRLNAEGSAALLSQSYGKLNIYHSDFKGSIGERPLLNNEYGAINISNSSFDFYSKYSKPVLINASNCISYNINSSDFALSGGNESTVLKFKNSSVILKSDNISSSNAATSSTTIESIDSRLNATYCRFNTLDSNRLSRAIASEDSSLIFNTNSFNFNARTGIIGFNITGGNSILNKNNITTEDCNDFIYLFILNGGNHQIETNIAETGTADDTVMLRSRKSDIDFINNTILFSAGRNNTIGFKPEGNSVNRIINNILITDGDISHSTLLYQDSENNSISLKNNSLYGWTKYTDGINETDNLVGLDLIDGIYSGGIYSGNINESPDMTFDEGSGMRLSEDSKCIDSGYDVENILENNLDFDGDYRPATDGGRSSSFDIGADEYYR
ncbi:MAG: chitobiase/beta-hexosaminidase C-terminal domain-containing protein [Spirochaetales bacterium]|uniref:Chitobiase/beta-hexosaminidase C-terminal domain-containing protein n=1 Tax=Candidatus Thalassospirochaeta sargassi TaxID=3119039 RepID=A0AAJ1IG07_9SPIO|nr:chitobiase/beta-hexosaminidase C-terminal domain-containing protein [Spirochaetales bacterium]